MSPVDSDLNHGSAGLKAPLQIPCLSISLAQAMSRRWAMGVLAAK